MELEARTDVKGCASRYGDKEQLDIAAYARSAGVRMGNIKNPMETDLLDNETEKLISVFGSCLCNYEANNKPKAESFASFNKRRSKHLDEVLAARENLRARIRQLVQEADESEAA